MFPAYRVCEKRLVIRAQNVNSLLTVDSDPLYEDRQSVVSAG